MSKAVTSRARQVVRQPPAPDRRRPQRVALIALVCFALGVGAVVWNAGGRRIVARPPARGAAAAEPPVELATAPHEETGVLVMDTGGAAVDASSAMVAAPVAAPEDGEADAPITAATPFTDARRVEPGRVAYLRCEGIPQRPGPYPCPRDQALEAAVWSILDTLPRCADAPSGLGESDVRLEVVAGAPTDVKLRAPRTGVPRLDGPALLRCAAGPLSHVTTNTGSTKLVVAFRFALVDARQPRGAP